MAKNTLNGGAGKLANRFARFLGYSRTPSSWPWERWSILQGHGTSRIVRSSLVWFFLVPAVARAMSLLPEEVSLEAFGAELTFRCSLPFRWSTLFWAAASFAAASVVFTWKCPRVIQKFRHAGDFHDAGENEGHLDDYANETGFELRVGSSPREVTIDFWTVFEKAN